MGADRREQVREHSGAVTAEPGSTTTACGGPSKVAGPGCVDGHHLLDVRAQLSRGLGVRRQRRNLDVEVAALTFDAPGLLVLVLTVAVGVRILFAPDLLGLNVRP